MQFIGFCSVIETIWAVDDSATTKISLPFYRHTVDKSGRLDYTHTALALNRVMKSVNILLDQQVLYIHPSAYVYISLFTPCLSRSISRRCS
ncbi:hypothetical protein L210DRAFT_3561041 [Boletus edulis BED1]|uniref:Uncharacterized protein n=1 Tax=Boletus edulis BED1 TaxID=1328754 RepID=A0AAD4G9D8_BOLED|nr:hypothetical protein L210DRAFT_3561041 [Boletus edulis BED1]